MIQALDLRPPATRLENSRGDLRRMHGSRFRAVHVLHIALALLIVANLGRLPVASSGAKDAPVLFNDLLVFALLCAGGLVSLRRRRFVIDDVAMAALSFSAIGFLSALLAVPKFDLNGFQLVFSLAYLARWMTYFGIYLIAINILRPDDTIPVWRTLERMILVFSAFGIVQSLFLPGFAQIVYPESEAYVDWDIQGHRLVSTFLDPNFAGALIVIALLVLLARLAFGVEVPLWKFLILFAALALTVSRSSIIAFAVGALVIASVRGLTRRVSRMAATMVLLVLPFVPVLVDYAASFNKFSVDASAMARVVSWLRAWEIFADNFVLGVGFNTYGFVREAYGYTENGMASFTLDGGLLFIAVMTGILGVLLYMAMVARVVSRCRSVWRNVDASAEERGLCLGTVAVTTALVVHSIFLNSLLLPYLMEPLWVLWSLSFVIQASLRRRANDYTVDNMALKAPAFAGCRSP